MRSEGVMASALRLVVGFIMGGFLMGKVTTVQYYLTVKAWMVRQTHRPDESL